MSQGKFSPLKGGKEEIPGEINLSPNFPSGALPFYYGLSVKDYNILGENSPFSLLPMSKHKT